MWIKIMCSINNLRELKNRSVNNDNRNNEKVQNGAVKFQENSDLNDSKLSSKVRESRNEAKEATCLLSETTEVFPIVTYIQSNPKSQKYLGNESTKISDDEVILMHNINECKGIIVNINNCISDFITPDMLPDHRTCVQENKMELVFNELEDSSSIYREAEHTDVDDTSGSDWEEEHSVEFNQIKPLGETKNEMSKCVNVLKNTNFAKDVTQSTISEKCSNKKKLTDVTSKTSLNKVMPNSSTSCDTITGCMSAESLSFTAPLNKKNVYNFNCHLNSNTTVNNIGLHFIPENKSGNNEDLIINSDKNFEKQMRTVTDVERIDSKIKEKVIVENNRNCIQIESTLDFILQDKISNITNSGNNSEKLTQVERNTCTKRQAINYKKKKTIVSSVSIHTQVESTKNSDIKSLQTAKSNTENVINTTFRKILPKPKGVTSVSLAGGLVFTLSGNIYYSEGTEIPKPFKCLDCGKVLDSHFQLQRHKTEHIKKCKMCGEELKTLKILNIHMKDKHDIIRPYECKECGKKFKKAVSLRNHCKFLHSSVESYFCDVCGKGFKRKTNLTQHMITHSDARPISCPECGDNFKRITHLKQHMASAHADGRK